jgi:hypothetical protein
MQTRLSVSETNYIYKVLQRNFRNKGNPINIYDEMLVVETLKVFNISSIQQFLGNFEKKI